MKNSTVLSLPFMAACVLLAFLSRGPVREVFVMDEHGVVTMVTSGWRLWMVNRVSTGFALVAWILFLRMVIEAVRVWKASGESRDSLADGSAGMHAEESRHAATFRMNLMLWMPFPAFLLILVGFLYACDMQLMIACVALAACMAAVGLVAAGSVTFFGKSIWRKAVAFVCLLVNLAPVGLAAYLIGRKIL